MSSSEIRALRSEVESLRLLCSSLQVTVGELRDRVEVLEGSHRLSAAEAGASASAGYREPDSVSGFSVVSSVSSNSEPVAVSDKEGRAQLALHIGRYLKRALAGEYRGSSGRSRLNLANRLYLILADFEGQRITPRVVREFSAVAAICKRGQATGNSIFIGFASQWEAQLACEEAGIEWPGL